MAKQHRTFSIRHEGGQSLVIVILAMTLIVAIAALAIDVSQWYATRHQAQVAADAAALAGANCMADGGTTANTSCGSIPGTYVSAAVARTSRGHARAGIRRMPTDWGMW